VDRYEFNKVSEVCTASIIRAMSNRRQPSSGLGLLSKDCLTSQHKTGGKKSCRLHGTGKLFGWTFLELRTRSRTLVPFNVAYAILVGGGGGLQSKDIPSIMLQQAATITVILISFIEVKT
jgi:hypothetical protein